MPSFFPVQIERATTRFSSSTEWLRARRLGLHGRTSDLS